MHPLHLALKSLQEQLVSGLSQGSNLSTSQGSVRPLNVSITLGLALQSIPRDPLHPDASVTVQWAVVPPGTTAQHSVTLELEFSGGTATEDGSLSPPRPLASAAPNLNSSESRAERLYKQCLAVFGIPGFDNAARAEVFCELASATSTVDLRAAIEHAGSDSKVSPTDPLARQTSRLRQIFTFSPVGPKRASVQLLHLIQEASMEELTALLSERWRFGTHWSLPTSSNGTAGN